MFSQSKQEEVNKQAKIVYDGAMSVGDLLERNSGKLNFNTRPGIEKLDRNISELLRLCNLYQSSVSMVYLNGQPMVIPAMFMIIRQIIQDIEQNTGYMFKCKS